MQHFPEYLFKQFLCFLIIASLRSNSISAQSQFKEGFYDYTTQHVQMLIQNILERKSHHAQLDSKQVQIKLDNLSLFYDSSIHKIIPLKQDTFTTGLPYYYLNGFFYSKHIVFDYHVIQVRLQYGNYSREQYLRMPCNFRLDLPYKMPDTLDKMTVQLYHRDTLFKSFFIHKNSIDYETKHGGGQFMFNLDNDSVYYITRKKLSGSFWIIDDPQPILMPVLQYTYSPCFREIPVEIPVTMHRIEDTPTPKPIVATFTIKPKKTTPKIRYSSSIPLWITGIGIAIVIFGTMLYILFRKRKLNSTSVLE